MRWVILSCIFIIPLMTSADDIPFPQDQQDLFISGQDGYHTYRIPAIIQTKKGTLLAFCEGRKQSRSDTGDIDLLVRRSTDGGDTWSDQQIVWDDGPNTCGNPCPVVDQETGVIWLLLTHNLGEDHESEIASGKSKGTRTVWVTSSRDDGQTWAEPKNISETTKKTNWTWYATGPGIGIQLHNPEYQGRMVIPCDHKTDDSDGKITYHSHVIYSDDHGKTWKLGGSTADGVNECQVVELQDGRLLLNMRRARNNPHQHRAIAWSDDGGMSWSDLQYDEELIEPRCQASMIRYTRKPRFEKNRILFSNPASKGRDKMTVRMSYDEGKTWPVSRLLYEGSAAYSCLCVLPDMRIGCFYERDNYGKITFARFSLKALTQGNDKKQKLRKESIMKRRTFLKTSSITASSLMVLNAKSVRTAHANSTMTIGLIGCGGRGNHDASNFRRVTDSKIVALADPYEDRLNSTKQRFEKDSPKIFQGFDAYKKVLDTDVDMVIITSPPYFHPEHFSAAMDAGKHVYLEKPVAVDTVGALKVREAGKKADGKLTAMVGFQSRYKEDLQGAVKRVHDGAIGRIICGQSYYHSGWLGPRHNESMPEQEQRIRNWVFDIALSGDILVEQNIHVLDVCNWIMQSTPIKAYGTGGREVRTFFGDTWDHYAVTYWYPNDVELSFDSTQFLKLGWGDAGERINGSKGAIDALCGPAKIRGENEWNYEGNHPNPEERKIKHFYESVMNEKFVNEIPQGVDSTLTAILGRTASYRNEEYTWEQMMNDKEKLDANLNL